MESDNTEIADIEALIDESHLLHQELCDVLEGHQHDGSVREKLTTVFLHLSQQHWLAFRCLMGEGLTHSAIPLLRLQFEATVKGFWVRYVASDEWIDRAGKVELKDKRPIEPPSKTIAEMLKAIQRTAHPLIGVQLKEFEEVHLKPLNSFIHSGISALSTLRSGLPEEFCCKLVRISNGLAGLGVTLLAEISGSVEANHAVFAIQAAHLRCMPPIRVAGFYDPYTDTIGPSGDK